MQMEIAEMEKWGVWGRGDGNIYISSMTFLPSKKWKEWVKNSQHAAIVGCFNSAVWALEGWEEKKKKRTFGSLWHTIVGPPEASLFKRLTYRSWAVFFACLILWDILLCAINAQLVLKTHSMSICVLVFWHTGMSVYCAYIPSVWQCVGCLCACGFSDMSIKWAVWGEAKSSELMDWVKAEREGWWSECIRAWRKSFRYTVHQSSDDQISARTCICSVDSYLCAFQIPDLWF